MGRRPREEGYGGVYHVIQRGNNRYFIFKEDDDKRFLIEQLKLAGKYGYRIYGYVIMGNHYHIVIRTVGEPLQSIIALPEFEIQQIL